MIYEEPPPTPCLSGESVIPPRIVIGVTGHRKLDATPQLAAQVRAAVHKIIRMAPPLTNTPLMVSVLSPLTEAADRLVAREVLKVSNAMIEVVLPLKKNDYVQDFQTSESKKEFEESLARASSVKTLPPRRTRDDAYYQVGQYVVEHCDVLIALWDGNPAAGPG